jgi:hypothetical protein
MHVHVVLERLTLVPARVPVLLERLALASTCSHVVIECPTLAWKGSQLTWREELVRAALRHPNGSSIGSQNGDACDAARSSGGARRVHVASYRVRLTFLHVNGRLPRHPVLAHRFAA